MTGPAAPGFPQDVATLLWKGGQALLAGAGSAAVAHFAAALDRTGERFVRTICHERGLAPDLVDRAWQALATRAGQRSGALSILFLIDTGAPLGVDPAMTQVRDRAAHQDRKFSLGRVLGPLAARVVPGARTIDVHDFARANRRQWMEREARAYGSYAFGLVVTIERTLQGRPGPPAAMLPADGGPEFERIEPGWTFDDLLSAVARRTAAHP